MTTLLSTTYFGPVQWYQHLYCAEQVLVEQWESFQKQTYRNRCIIASPNGPQALTVPVERSTRACLQRTGDVQCIKDLRISDHGEWRHQHWNALTTAYGDSPFFDYYQDDLQPFFTERRWTYLLDFNMEACAVVCDLLDIQPRISLTESFLPPTQNLPPYIIDMREAIRPKHPADDPDFTPRPYYQVYAQRHGFLPNLSVLDLLFNMGPESVFYLKLRRLRSSESRAKLA